MKSLPLRLAGLVKLEHTIFALPFCFMSAVVAGMKIPDLRTTALILAAMVGARTAAMAYNRIVDVDMDAKNPRTSGRELVTGAVSTIQAWTLLALSCVLFIYAAYCLNQLAFILSFPALLVILGYSYTKRFTALSHLVLGLSLGIAPVGAWVAVTGEIGLASIILAAAVMAWTAGFDIIYSLQDTEFDIKHGLHSVPAAIGEERALWVSRGLHVLMAILLAWFGNESGLGMVYDTGVVLVILFLVWEHSLVTPCDKSRINVAFFTLNGFVSLTLFALTVIDVLG